MQTPEERAAAFYAEQIKRTGAKVLRFFPKRKTFAAAANKIRYYALHHILTGKPPNPDHGANNNDLEYFERLALEQGYTFEDADPAEYEPNLYRPLL